MESELYDKNKTDSYMPGWYGKGLKKSWKKIYKLPYVVSITHTFRYFEHFEPL